MSRGARRPKTTWLWYPVLALSSAGCEERAPRDVPLPLASAAALDALSRPHAPAPKIASGAPRELPTPTRGTQLNIPAGVLRLGSAIGSAFRNPAREADDVPIELPAFAIDALPYPNDPASPPLANVSRADAARLCGAEGKRLCSELEWERACKGDENLEYPSVKGFDASRCTKEPLACHSPFGVFALGTQGREWTLSNVPSGLGDRLRTAAVRGAGKESESTLHRCAARDAATPDSKSDSLVFRCCKGPAPSAAYPEPEEHPPFEQRALTESEIRAALAAMPETSALAGSFRLFTNDERTKTLAKAGHSRAGMSPWLLADRPLAWSPVRGEQLIVLAGDTARGAALVAYYPLPGGRALFAASLETQGEHTALVLATKEDTPGEVLFSSCWGCGGEGGALALSADARVRIVQR